MNFLKETIASNPSYRGTDLWAFFRLSVAVAIAVAALATAAGYLASNNYWLQGLGIGALAMSVLGVAAFWMVRRERCYRQTLDDLVHRQEQLEGLLNALPDPVILKDAEHRWVIANDAFCAIANQSRESLLGKSDYDFFPQHEAEVFWAKDDAVLTTGQANVHEETITDSSGATRQLITRKTRLTDNTGQRYIAAIGRDVTQERDLLAWRKRYACAALTRRLVIYEYDPKQNKGLFGGAIEEVLGYDAQRRGEIEWWLSLVHPEDRDLFQEFVKQALTDGNTNHAQHYRMIRKDGNQIHVEDRNFAELDQHGQVIRVIGSIADVTERMKAQEAILEGQEWLRVTQDAAGIGTWDWSIATDTMRYSPAHRLMYGLPSQNEYVTYAQWVQTIHPEDRARVEKELLRAVETGDPYRSEFRVVWPDGSVHWINNSGKLLRDQAEQPVRMIGAAFEITERKSAEEALRHSHDLLERRVMTRTDKLREANEALKREKETAQHYLATINVMVIVLNAQGRVILVNRKGCELLEDSESAILGGDWFEDFIPPEQQAEVRAVFASILRGDLLPVQNYDNFIVTRSGRRRLIRWSNNFITDQNGVITSLIGSGEDITEQKQAEEALKRSESLLKTTN
ncbi:MAG: PAS domain S-box protein, partial [Candidatus Competibacteraceae bacterium]